MVCHIQFLFFRFPRCVLSLCPLSSRRYESGSPSLGFLKVPFQAWLKAGMVVRVGDGRAPTLATERWNSLPRSSLVAWKWLMGCYWPAWVCAWEHEQHKGRICLRILKP